MHFDSLMRNKCVCDGLDIFIFRLATICFAKKRKLSNHVNENFKPKIQKA